MDYAGEPGRNYKSLQIFTAYDRVHFVDSKKSARSYYPVATRSGINKDIERSSDFIEELQGDVSDERDFPENLDRFF